MTATRRAERILPLVACLMLPALPALGGKLTVDLGSAKGVTMVGAFNRWDIDGNHRTPPNQKAKIDVPEVAAKAKPAGDGKWVFDNLPEGTYDLVVMAEGRTRIEGFTYPPVLEFDPFIKPDATCDEDIEEFITDDIHKAQHYENKVEPLYMGGDDEKTVRVLVMLIRDKTTSYEGEMPGAATMRFEAWQYDWQYGGWRKNKRTKVFHRVLTTRGELRQWTWLWDPKLGGIEVKGSPVTVEYAMPGGYDTKLKGLRPY